MTGIQIVDLPESIELDREAMSKLYGGSSAPLALGLNSRKRRDKNHPRLFFPDGDSKRRRAISRM